MKLLIIVNSSGLNGFTKSLLYLILNLQKYNIHIDLYTLQDLTDYMLKQLPDTVNIIKNNLIVEYRRNNESFIIKILIIVLSGRVFYSLVKKILKWTCKIEFKLPVKLAMKFYQVEDYIRARLIKSRYNTYDYYDAVISWQESFCNYLLALKIEAPKKIGFIHPDYIDAHFYRFLDTKILTKLDYIIVLSPSGKKSLLKAIPDMSNKVIIVPNLLSVEQIRKLASEKIQNIDLTCFTIVTVCRIDNVSKAIDRAIRICKRLCDDGLSFKWYVLGDGGDKNAMEEMVKKYRIDDKFVFLGEKENPYPYIKIANLFVLQSYYEGSPLVVKEALVIGTPVLVTNYSSATDFIENEVNGYIVRNDEFDIYIKLKSIIEKPDQLSQIRQALNVLEWDKFNDCSKFIEAMKS